jgi:inositol 1,4,5-triphosphate receptor type 1/inositol 1,4,5-triphosphate receptor type 3
MHVASSRFLACHEIESRYENQNYKLQLDDFSSEATVFNVVPAFKY